MDIKEVSQDFKKLSKSDNCIIIHMKNDSKVAITSPVSPPAPLLIICTYMYVHVQYVHVHVHVYVSHARRQNMFSDCSPYNSVWVMGVGMMLMMCLLGAAACPPCRTVC